MVIAHHVSAQVTGGFFWFSRPGSAAKRPGRSPIAQRAGSLATQALPAQIRRANGPGRARPPPGRALSQRKPFPPGSAAPTARTKPDRPRAGSFATQALPARIRRASGPGRARPPPGRALWRPRPCLHPVEYPGEINCPAQPAQRPPRPGPALPQPGSSLERPHHPGPPYRPGPSAPLFPFRGQTPAIMTGSQCHLLSYR
jgi:hypothetical protein